MLTTAIKFVNTGLCEFYFLMRTVIEDWIIVSHWSTSFGASEDNSECSLQWDLYFILWPSERVHAEVYGRKSCVILGDGQETMSDNFIINLFNISVKGKTKSDNPTSEWIRSVRVILLFRTLGQHSFKLNYLQLGLFRQVQKISSMTVWRVWALYLLSLNPFLLYFSCSPSSVP